MDLIERKLAIATIAEYERDSTKPIDYMEIIRQLPSAQPESIIHCIECKYCSYDATYRHYWCSYWVSSHQVYADGFCNYARRN